MRKHKLLICIFVCISIVMGIQFAKRDKITNQILAWIDRRLDYERSLEVGDEFNKMVWGDLTFQINHYKTGNNLDYVKNGKKTPLLNSVINYKILADKLYVVALDGYAVVDSNNIAKVYVISGDNNPLSNVKCLDSFEMFEKEEQEAFKKLIN